MIEIMKSGHPLWNKTITFAENCSWRAGTALAKRMRENDFAENERVLVALENDDIAGFCTFANNDELPVEYDFSPFIGFMFVDEKYRGHRLSGKLIDAACGIAKEQGFSTVYIMSGEVGLYEKYGFEKLGDYATIYGTTDQLFHKEIYIQKWQN